MDVVVVVDDGGGMNETEACLLFTGKFFVVILLVYCYADGWMDGLTRTKTILKVDQHYFFHPTQTHTHTTAAVQGCCSV